MRYVKILMPVIVGLMLSACNSSTELAGQLKLATPSQTLTNDCNDPVALPSEGKLSRDEVTIKWLTDRASLTDCKERHKSLVKFYTLRDTALK